MNGSFREPFDVELTSISERPDQLNLTSVDEVGDLSHYLPIIISHLADCPHQAKQSGVEAGSNLWRLIELRFHCCQRSRRVYSFFFNTLQTIQRLSRVTSRGPAQLCG